jgi:S-adenosylmethionine synthetase
MFEKVNPSHPDKVADRIAGALVDIAYQKSTCPKVAIEVLIGHKQCTIIAESSVLFTDEEVASVVERIAGNGFKVYFHVTPQDSHLASNQSDEIRCGDNGIFKGTPETAEQKELCSIVNSLYKDFPHDGKFIINDQKLIMCQSNISSSELQKMYPDAVVNPLGDWTGGTDVDTGATNRKLGSDMGDSVTGGGLHGKDLSKADVSVNIYAYLKAQKEQKPVELFCAIGDTTIDGKPYGDIVEIAKQYILDLGGFEKFAEWGLIR